MSSLATQVPKGYYYSREGFYVAQYQSRFVFMNRLEYAGNYQSMAIPVKTYDTYKVSRLNKSVQLEQLDKLTKPTLIEYDPATHTFNLLESQHLQQSFDYLYVISYHTEPCYLT